jgi:hypothetical protein
MTSDTIIDAMRSTSPAASRWRRYLSDLAATQPPPPPAIARVATIGRLMASSHPGNDSRTRLTHDNVLEPL